MKRDYTECLGFDDRLFRLIGIPVVSFLIPPVFYNHLVTDPMVYVHGLLFTLVTWEGNRGVFIYVNKRFPRIDQWRQRLTWLLSLCILYTGLACTILSAVLMLFTNSALVHTDFTDPIKSYGVSYLLVMAIGAVYQSIHFFRLWEKTVREKESLERAHLSSQLEGLRNQVNPHFLFNSLNTLNYLIPEDSEKAVRFVQQLSKVYRYVLESRDDKLIPISQELQFLDAYIFLQKERFGEKLQVSMQGLEDNHSYAIVPLTLQMLFENAIKHNIISTESPLVVELFIEGESLIVRNNLQRKNQVMDSTGVGLQNIKERYRMLLDKTVDVIVSDRYYTVVLPLIKLSNESV
jgi:sensor histidine kinase YesM